MTLSGETAIGVTVTSVGSQVVQGECGSSGRHMAGQRFDRENPSRGPKLLHQHAVTAHRGADIHKPSDAVAIRSSIRRIQSSSTG